MPSRKVPNSNPAFPRAIRDPLSSEAPKRPRSSGAPTGGGAFLGFVFVVLVNFAVLWLAVEILRSAGVVSWKLSPVETLSLAVLWIVWRAVDRLTSR